MLKSRPPTVKNNLLSLAATNSDAVTLVPVGSALWFEWLANHQGFLFEGGAGHFTARRELRRGREYWYAHRRRAGKLFKTYLGKSEALSAERLERASVYLAGQAELSIWPQTKTRLPA